MVDTLTYPLIGTTLFTALEHMLILSKHGISVRARDATASLSPRVSVLPEPYIHEGIMALGRVSLVLNLLVARL